MKVKEVRQKVDQLLTGARRREMGSVNGYRVSIWGDECVLELYSDYGCPTLLIY